ncbi:MAG: FAD-binding and (Fe-S)-binding domain-containing protein [Candidatus Geothermincolia bacterium]
MGKLDETAVGYFERAFDGRVSFDETERRLYGHDIGSIPGMVKPFTGRTVPDAVVQPESEQELVDLVRWARAGKVPLVPRGKATSGYGGAVPTRGGVVVDFYRMRSVVSVDASGARVTVQPGITWEALDRELASHGLTLRLYPSSYPSSTVGGWLAQGGAGFGSFEFGYFSRNVVSARVVLPTGEVRDMSGDDLEVVSEAEGITGLISQVTLEVMPLEELAVLAFECGTTRGLQSFIEDVVSSGLPVWSLMFINPRMAEMKNRAPQPSAHAGMGEAPVLPRSYITVLTCRARDALEVRESVEALAGRAGAEALSDDIAHHEWENRFKIMLVKRLGPSLVPAEVVVPLGQLGDAMDEMEAKVRHPVLKEGIIVKDGRGGKPEAVLLGFIPADERTFSYNLMFGLSLSIMNIAARHGGRAYATGLYFSGRADEVLGERRVRKLRDFKSGVDPAGIMNPDKVLGGGVLPLMVKAGSLFEPLVRIVGNLVAAKVGERIEKDVRGVPADVAWYAYTCSQCGYCVDSCPEFYGRGWESASPRGKWYWLREYMEGRARWDQRMVDTFLVCTTCETCNLRCSEGLPIEPSWMKMRGELIQRKKMMTFPPFEMMAAALESQGDIWAGYRKDRAAWFPADLVEKHGVGVKAPAVYFAGCTASYVENDIGMATVRLLDEAGVDFTYLGEKESCCATPMLVAGKWDLFEATMRKNIAAVKETGADTVISSCPACDLMWRQVYPEWCEKLGIDYGITARHYSEVVTDRIKDGSFAFSGQGEPTRVTFHDSCHIGRASGVFEPPRELIEAVPGAHLVEMAHNREEALCCGSVLTLIKDPPIAAGIGATRLDEVESAGADKVLALCPCCEFQLRVSADKAGSGVVVEDLARFAASSLGYDFPAPEPAVQAQWAVFDAMIALMTPEGFADLMGTMWPELIDAMPLRMGAMMRLMGRVPGALKLMRPLFPVLFPRLLPVMMPKVMPVMLERIGARVPMPDYMLEQMGDLMPKVMDNLMPHMIGDVVPLIADPMIRYLRGGN